MSTETILPYSAYLRLPPDDHNSYEMLWGVLYVAASPRVNHQRVLINVSARLHEHVRIHDLGMVVGPIDLYRDEINYVQPDISYFTAEQASLIIDEQTVRIPPPLVVEILSPSTEGKDRADKRRWYAEMGVREYWLVDSKARSVTVIDLADDTERIGYPVRSAVLPGLSLGLMEIFG